MVANPLGDSIGAQWSPTLSGVLRRPNWQILVLTKSACGIVDTTWYYEKVGGDYLVCTEWRNKVLEYLADIQPDIVFVGSSARYDFSPDDWVGGTRRVLDKLAPLVGEVVLEVLGAEGLEYGSFADANYRMAMTAGVAVGASEVQLNLIASHHLGLPRE